MFIAVNANSYEELEDFENNLRQYHEIVIAEPTRQNKRYGMFGKLYKIFRVYRKNGGSNR